MITVIDYGMGNSGSIMNILSRIGAEACLTADPAMIAQADKLVLPGVGAFDNGMDRLHDLGLVPILNEKVLVQHTPILGICLGVQLFCNGSQEGVKPGLGWIDADVIRFRFDGVAPNGDGTAKVGGAGGLKIPHMGWNTITVAKEHPIFENIADDARFYFVHSYHVQCNDAADILARSHYGIDFTACVARNSIIGLQFHPEKSLRWGMEVFRRFVQINQMAGVGG